MKRSMVARGWGRKGNRCSTEDVLGNETIVNDGIMLDICHYIFVKTHRLYNTMSDPQCKLWTLSDNEVSTNVAR